MATATTAREIPQPPTNPVKNVTLILSPEEAVGLALITGEICGSGPLQAINDRIYYALTNYAGVPDTFATTTGNDYDVKPPRPFRMDARPYLDSSFPEARIDDLIDIFNKRG